MKTGRSIERPFHPRVDGAECYLRRGCLGRGREPPEPSVRAPEPDGPPQARRCSARDGSCCRRPSRDRAPAPGGPRRRCRRPWRDRVHGGRGPGDGRRYRRPRADRARAPGGRRRRCRRPWRDRDRRGRGPGDDRRCRRPVAGPGACGVPPVQAAGLSAERVPGARLRPIGRAADHRDLAAYHRGPAAGFRPPVYRQPGFGPGAPGDPTGGGAVVGAGAGAAPGAGPRQPAERRRCGGGRRRAARKPPPSGRWRRRRTGEPRTVRREPERAGVGRPASCPTGAGAGVVAPPRQVPAGAGAPVVGVPPQFVCAG